MPATVRLTAAEALVRWMVAQRSELLDGSEVPLFAGVFAIFGHGNVLGLGPALHAVRDKLPTWRGQAEEGMALAAVAYAKAMDRRQVMVATASVGPGALNMVTAAGRRDGKPPARAPAPRRHVPKSRSGSRPPAGGALRRPHDERQTTPSGQFRATSTGSCNPSNSLPPCPRSLGFSPIRRTWAPSCSPCPRTSRSRSTPSPSPCSSHAFIACRACAPTPRRSRRRPSSCVLRADHCSSSAVAPAMPAQVRPQSRSRKRTVSRWWTRRPGDAAPARPSPLRRPARDHRERVRQCPSGRS